MNVSKETAFEARPIVVLPDAVEETGVNSQLDYQVDDKPSLPATVILGFQNIVTALGGLVAVPLIVAGMAGMDVTNTAFLVSAALFASGLNTVIQSIGFGRGRWRVGAGVPTIMGTDFTFVGPAGIVLAAGGGMAGYLGGSMMGALFELFLSRFIKPLMRFFPPVVTGTVISLIGMTLIPVSMDWWAGGFGSADYGSARNIMLGFVVFAVILLLNRYGKGMVSNASILIGMALGYLIATALGMVSFSSVATAQWIQFPQIFRYGISFDVRYAIPFLAGYVVTVIETVGVMKAIGAVTGVEMTDERIERGVRADGFGSFISGIFGSGPAATFSQNVGLIPLTKCASRQVAVMAGILLFALGLLPKFATIVSLIPSPVLGGAGILMFGTVAAAGISSLAEVKLNNRNMLIIASALAFGLGVTFRPEILKDMPYIIQAVFGNGISGGTIIAFLLNIILKEEKEA